MAEQLNQSPTISVPQPPSILVMANNRADNLTACLETLKFSDDIVVLDGTGDGRAGEIAAQFPKVRVIRRPFDSEEQQRDFGLREIEYTHPWIFICGSDELVSSELAQEIVQATGHSDSTQHGFAVRRRTGFLERWIEHADNGSWSIRLIRLRGVDGPVGKLRHRLTDKKFSSGLKRVLYQQNEQSTHEAAALISAAKSPHVNYFLGLSAIARFLKFYLLQSGFLDGMAGMHYCWLLAMEQYWTDLKIREHESNWRGEINSLTQELLNIGQPVEPVNPKTSDGRPLVEFMIPTLNESEHIGQAIASAIKLGPVFVLDSFSNDGTQDLARAAGASVVEHKFVHYAAQKNWGLDNLPFQGEWIFILDADERITPLLHKEIVQICSQQREPCGYYINRALLILGANVRHGGLYPSWNLRLFRRGKARYEDRAVHEHVICSGPTDYLTQEMLHVRRETMAYYLEKHIKYADMESEEWIKRHLGQNVNATSKELFKSVLRFRQWIRRKVWPRLPARPIFRFVYMYFVRLGLLDGRAGWHIAELMACYEYMISLLYKDKLQRVRSQKDQVGERISSPQRS